MVNLKSNGFRWEGPLVVDEVFLFDRKEFAVILEVWDHVSPLTIYGDPFQMDTPGLKQNGFFYELLHDIPYTVTWLTVHHR